jgi:hypothetical protein
LTPALGSPPGLAQWAAEWLYLNLAGLVFLPADDLVEPIIGFLPEGQYDPSPDNPLGALIRAGWTSWSIYKGPVGAAIPLLLLD